MTTMASKERAVIYVEPASTLTSKSSSSSMLPHGSNARHIIPKIQDKNNYVIKIQIGEETMYNPVRIDVTTKNPMSIGNPGRVGGQCVVNGGGVGGGGGLGKSTKGEDSPLNSSGQSSPRSDMTPPPRINSGAIRFGSETSESDTESDVSAEYRPLTCPTAQFAMREMLEMTMEPMGPTNPKTKSKTVTAKGSGVMKSMSYVSSPRQDVPPKVQFKEILSHSGNFNGGRANSNHHHLPLQGTLSLCPTSTLMGDSMTSMTGGQHSSLDNRNSCHSSSGENSSIESVRMSLLKTQLRMPRFLEEQENSTNGKPVLTDDNPFHLDEFNVKTVNEVNSESISNNFAGYKDIFARAKQDGQAQIMSEKGTIRGVKNRVRDGIATFLQSKDIKTYSDKEQGRVVVYTTSMGVVRATSHRCQKVKQILRTLLVKFDERDCYMNRAVQDEIRQRLPPRVNNNNNPNNNNQSSSLTSIHNNDNCNPDGHSSIGIKFLSKTNDHISLPQVFLEGQHLGDAETIEKLNETGELRDMLKPYKSLSVLSTCDRCGGYRMLPCPVCNGSKKSVHRNDFTTEFVALKCMHCDPSGLVNCDVCNNNDC